MNLIVNDFFLICRGSDTKLNSLTVGFNVIIRLFHNLRVIRYDNTS